MTQFQSLQRHSRLVELPRKLSSLNAVPSAIPILWPTSTKNVTSNPLDATQSILDVLAHFQAVDPHETDRLHTFDCIAFVFYYKSFWFSSQNY